MIGDDTRLPLEVMEYDRLTGWGWSVLDHEAKLKILIRYNELTEVLGFGESILDSFNSFVARKMIE